jgi:hypothetical protein
VNNVLNWKYNTASMKYYLVGAGGAKQNRSYAEIFCVGDDRYELYFGDSWINTFSSLMDAREVAERTWPRDV